ncbi:MAG: 5-oxoprolinase subunit PxpB [Alphaproteobacteria bacterium]|nr:5-oxoprolinase subunit PxpB [Alphaproteobacteria bacterium]
MTLAEASAIAEDAISIRTPSAVAAHALAARLRATGVFDEVTPGLDSVGVLFDPLRLDAGAARRLLADAAQAIETADWPDNEVIELRARYGGDDGPDLDRLAAAANLSPDAFIELHTKRIHRVEMIGFMPGFAYLSGLDPALEAPRLKTPRPRLPAGSIGVSGAFTGLYAIASPGGWPIIGRIDETLFDPDADNPFRLAPGDRVRFLRAPC